MSRQQFKVGIFAGRDEAFDDSAGTGCVYRRTFIVQRQARRDAGCLRVSALRAPDRESYRNKAEAREAITSQAAAHSPSDINTMTVKDTPSDHSLAIRSSIHRTAG